MKSLARVSALSLLLTAPMACAQTGPLSNGYIYTYAGNGTQGFSGDGGPATSAELWVPLGVTLDAAGNLYTADSSNNRIRKVDAASGVISTVAGNGIAGNSGDGGPATNAELYGPTGIVSDAAGNLYFSVTGDGNGNNSFVRKVDASTGIVTAVAGGGLDLGGIGDGGPATSAYLQFPEGLALDANNNLYIADCYNNRIRKVDAATGIISTVAGTGMSGYSGDGGPATSGTLTEPSGIVFDAAGNLYIADWGNKRVRKVDASTGIITTVAGDGIEGYIGDGGPATSAELFPPYGVALDNSGNLYISDQNISYGYGDEYSSSIRRVDANTEVITTVAGGGNDVCTGSGATGDGGLAVGICLDYPSGMVLDASGNLYIAEAGNNRIRVVRPEALPATTTTLTAVPTTLTVGQSLTLTATVTAASGSAPAGTVTFYNGASSLGSGSLNGSGVATLTLTPAAGSYSITASYGGSTADGPSQSAPPVVVTVNDIATTTSLTASATSLTLGQALTLTATVTGASGPTPAGTVTFFNGTVSLGSGTLNNSGVATRTVTPATGSYSITASYGGSSSDASSQSAPPVLVSVNPLPTTPVATPVFSPAGGTYTSAQTVSISDATPGATIYYTTNGTTPTTNSTVYSGPIAVSSTETLEAIAAFGGAVVFSEDFDELTPALTVTAVGQFTAINGTNVDIAGPGSQAILCAPPESGNCVDLGGTGGNPLGQLQSNPITLGPGSYDLSFDLIGSQRGVTTTTSVNLAPISGLPLYSNDFTLASGDDTSGIVTNFPLTIANSETVYLNFDLISTPVGNIGQVLDNVLINYAADSSAVATAAYTIGTPTSTTLIGVPTTLTFGQSLTLTGTVTAASGATPTGTVTFLNGAASLGSGSLNNNGVATLTLTPAAGAYSITASYGGSSSDNSSASSPPVTVTVTTAATTTTLTASPNPAPFGATAAFTATVTSSAGTPGGSVSFFDSTALLSTVTLASGVATYSTSALSVGPHNITAVYAGATDYVSSTSNLVVEVISPADFGISAAPSSLSVLTGEAASFTVTIAPGTGFNLPVALSCSQAPENTTCSFSPATVTGGSGISTLVVQTSAPHPGATASGSFNKLPVPLLAGLLLLLIPRRWRRRNRWPMVLMIFAAFVAAAAMTGCGQPGPLAGATPLGAQTVTVTGTAVNGSQTVTHTTSVTLNVISLF